LVTGVDWGNQMTGSDDKAIENRLLDREDKLFAESVRIRKYFVALKLTHEYLKLGEYLCLSDFTELLDDEDSTEIGSLFSYYLFCLAGWRKIIGRTRIAESKRKRADSEVFAAAEKIINFTYKKFNDVTP
jgi:hypothetical protein